MPMLSRSMKLVDVRRLIAMLQASDNSGGHMGDGHTGRLELGSNKKIWSDLAKRYLRMIGYMMDLVSVDAKYKPRDPVPAGRFHVYFNPGGPAVAGDVYLNTNALHVCISGESTFRAIMFRSETHKPNYMGPNMWMSFSHLEEPERVAQRFKEVHSQLTNQK